MSLDDTPQENHDEDPSYLEEIYGVSLLRIGLTRPEPVTVIARPQDDRRDDPSYLEEIYGVSLLPIHRTHPEPVTLSSRSRCLWFELLPLEIRELILVCVFDDRSIPDQIDQFGILERMTLQHPQVVDCSMGTVLYQNGTIPLPSLAFILPTFKQLFVSRKYLSEALKVYRRVSYILIPDFLRMYELHENLEAVPVLPNNSTISDLANTSQNAILHPTRSYTDMTPQAMRIAAHVTRFDVICSAKIYWAPLCEFTLSECFILRSPHTGLPTLYVFTRAEVSAILNSLAVPTALLRELKANTVHWQFGSGIVWTAAQGYTYYMEALETHQILCDRGWRGKFFYTFEFGCGIALSEDEYGMSLISRVPFSDFALICAHKRLSVLSSALKTLSVACKSEFVNIKDLENTKGYRTIHD